MHTYRAILFLLGLTALCAAASEPQPIQGLGVGVNPEVLVTNPGGTIAFSLRLTRINLDTPVPLAISGAPPGSQISISENPVTAANAEPVIVLDIPASAATGTYPLSIQAGNVKTAAELVVQP